MILSLVKRSALAINQPLSFFLLGLSLILSTFPRPASAVNSGYIRIDEKSCTAQKLDGLTYYDVVMADVTAIQAMAKKTENYLNLGPIDHGYGEIADVISERAFSTIFSPTQTEMIVKPQVMQGYFDKVSSACTDNTRDDCGTPEITIFCDESRLKKAQVFWKDTEWLEAGFGRARTGQGGKQREIPVLKVRDWPDTPCNTKGDPIRSPDTNPDEASAVKESVTPKLWMSMGGPRVGFKTRITLCPGYFDAANQLSYKDHRRLPVINDKGFDPDLPYGNYIDTNGSPEVELLSTLLQVYLSDQTQMDTTQDLVVPSFSSDLEKDSLNNLPLYWKDCVYDKKKFEILRDDNGLPLGFNPAFKWRRTGCMATLALALNLSPNQRSKGRPMVYDETYNHVDWRMGVVSRVSLRPPKDKDILRQIQEMEAELFNRKYQSTPPPPQRPPPPAPVPIPNDPQQGGETSFIIDIPLGFDSAPGSDDESK